MAQQTSFYYSSHRDDSKPRTFPNNNYTNWQSQTATGQDMTRHLSNDSAYYSTISQNSDDAYFSKQSPTTMSFGAGSPHLYDDDNFSTPQYRHPQYLESSPPLERSNSNRSSSSRATPSSLGWPRDASMLGYYKFVIPKGKEPYFELLPPFFVSPGTPERVYLDSPTYSSFSGSSSEAC